MTQDQFIFDVILGILAFAALFLLIILLLRANYVLKVRSKEQARKAVQEWMPKYLFGTEDEKEEAAQALFELMQSEMAANILLDEVTMIYTEFSGEVADKVKALFMDLKLYTIGLKNLESAVWYKKKHGLLQLSLMQYQEAYSHIAKLRAHRDKDIRRKARVASIRLRKKEALMEIKDERGVVSRWALVSIASILDRQSEQLTTEDVDALRAAKNKYIRTLVPFFAQKQAEHAK